MRAKRYQGMGVDDGILHVGELLHECGLTWINDNGLHCQVDPQTVIPRRVLTRQLNLFVL